MNLPGCTGKQDFFPVRGHNLYYPTSRFKLRSEDSVCLSISNQKKQMIADGENCDTECREMEPISDRLHQTIRVIQIELVLIPLGFVLLLVMQ